MISVRDINMTQGLKKFNGDVKQFANMILTFDKITLDDSLAKIYVSMHREKQNIKPAVKEIYNLMQSADTVEATGLSYHCNALSNQISNFQGVHDALFHSLLLYDKFIEKVLDFKDEIKKISQREYLDNTQIAKGIQHDIRLTILNMNEQQNQLHQSRQQQYASNFQLNNSYSQVGANQLLSQHQTIEQQNQNYSYFMNLNRHKETIVNQVQNESKSLNASRVLYPDNIAQSIRGTPNYQQFDEVNSEQQSYNQPNKRVVNFQHNPDFIEEHQGEEEHCKCYIF